MDSIHNFVGILNMAQKGIAAKSHNETPSKKSHDDAKVDLNWCYCLVRKLYTSFSLMALLTASVWEWTLSFS